MKKITQKAWKYCFLFLCIFIPVVGYFYQVYDYLSINRYIISDILVVEGWLSDDALEKAREEFFQKKYRMILTTGFPYYQGILIGSNGKIEFMLDTMLPPATDHNYSIGVTIRGTKSRGEFPHIILYADSTILGDYYISLHKKQYNCRLKLDSPPKLIRVEFDNDTYTKFTDRNLYLYSVSVNCNIFPANRENVTYYFRRNGKYYLHQRLSNSGATSAAQFLHATGISDSLAIPVETLHKIRSKTYTTALDVKAWLEKNKPGRHSITIFTEATHARRSYLSFVKAFGDSADIGIISYTDQKMNRSNWWKSRRGWRTILYETVGIFYICVFV